MKKLLTLTIAILTVVFVADAQVDMQKFTDDIRHKCLPVQDQMNSGTCWSFATMSFMESEMICNGNANPPNLSEMFVVRGNYIDRAHRYVSSMGHVKFTEGSYPLDAFIVMQEYGLMPESEYRNSTRLLGTINHTRLFKTINEHLDTVIAKQDRYTPIPGNWRSSFENVLNRFLPQPKTEFTYQGKTYTPRTFADEVVRLNADDYVQFTSMKDFRYYDYCSPAMRYNWRFHRFWNIPLDRMMDVIDCTLKSGHTVLWLCDVSDPGFNHDGEADLIGHPDVTEEYRMECIRTLSTTDDHIMHIIGTAHDRDGRRYYIVKNSWGTEYNGHQFSGKGYVYVSREYVMAKTIAILVHKAGAKKAKVKVR